LPSSFSIAADTPTTFTQNGKTASGFTGSETFDVIPGKYTITETNYPVGWVLYSSVDQNGIEHIGQASEDITISANETVTIYYYDYKIGGPGWPLPELPAGLLLALGLSGIGIYLAIKMRNAHQGIR
jgi:hypothetical protein